MVPAGEMFPYSQDPETGTSGSRRPSPRWREVEQAAEGIALCTLLAASEKVLEGRKVIGK